MRKIKNIIVRNTSVTLFSEVLVGFFFISVAIAASRFFAPADIGLMAIVHLLLNTVSALVSYGIIQTIIQSDDNDERAIASLFWLSFMIHLVVAGVIYCGAPLMSTMVRHVYAIPFFRHCAILIVVQSLAVVPEALLRKRFRMGIVSFYYIVRNFFYASITLLLLFMGYGIWSVLWGVTGGIVSAVIFIYVKTKWTPKLAFPFGIKKLSSFMGGVYFLKVLSFCRHYIEYVLILFYFDIQLVGHYYLAYKIAEFMSGKISIICNRVLYPLFTAYKEADMLRDMFNQVVLYSAAVALPIYVYLAISAEDLVFFFYGPKWGAAVMPLRILSLYCCIQVFSRGLLPSVLIAQRKVSFLNIFGSLAFLNIILLMFFWGKKNGLNGFAYVITIVECGFLVALILYISRLRLLLWSMLLRKWYVLASAIISCVLLYQMLQLLPLHPSLLFVLSTMSYIAIYTSIMCKFKIKSLFSFLVTFANN